jgi:hypothetical protein
MSSVMPYDHGRAQAIRELTKLQEDDARGSNLLTSKLIIKGTVVSSPIYHFRLSQLNYNKANGRIKAEVSEFEAQRGRLLNMEFDSDMQIIKQILLSIRKDENEKILEDLKKNGQLQPGIVTCDGIIINGNRRHALLDQLFNQTHDDRFNCLDAHVLPADITKSEIWLIEAGIQLSTPQQLDYSPINHLLKLREGVDSGLEVSEMAQRIYGVDENKLSRDLDRLSLIDEYLDEYLQKPGRYHLIGGLAEHFIDLQNILDWIKNPRGPVHRDWESTIRDINELKLVAFYFIRAKFPHLRIRDLRNLFCRHASWIILREVLNIKDTTEIEDNYPIEDTAGDEEDFEVESSGDSVEIVGPIIEQDRIVEREWKQKVEGHLKNDFEEAMEQQNIERHKEKPLSLARKALRHLEGIPKRSADLTDPAIDKVLSQIISCVNGLRKILQKTVSPTSPQPLRKSQNKRPTQKARHK